MKHFYYLPFLVLALAACSSSEVKQNLGFERSAPDEFRVVSRPPLSVPPEFNLRPPTPGDNSTNQAPAHDQAKAAVMGEGSVKKSGELTDADRAKPSDTAVPVVKEAELPSPAESKFLSNVGVQQADPAIRDKLYQEKAAPPPEEAKTWFDSMWPQKDKVPVVDPKAEAARIKKNQAENKPVTEGETPVTKPKDKGVLDRIWNNDDE